jgi:1-acyl-sn-glycerol-3-phosphate acyltransferase
VLDRLDAGLAACCRRIGRRLPKPGPGGFVYHGVRLFLRCVSAVYVQVRVEGAERLPPGDGGYIVCFNHPSWLDPLVIAGWWPDRRRRLFIFGPREQDMTVGARNALITWTGYGVPFQPGGADALDATRRSLAVLRGGGVLAIAGEGRLSDHEGDPLPFEPGVGHFAQLARVPIVPLSVDGTRWVHFRSRVRLVIGEPIDPRAFGSGRAAAARIADAARDGVAAGLTGVTDRPTPGPFGAWLSELFNDRPWLDEVPVGRPPAAGTPEGPRAPEGAEPPGRVEAPGRGDPDASRGDASVS